MNSEKSNPSEDLIHMVGYICTHLEPSDWPHRGLGKKFNVDGAYYQYYIFEDGRTVYKVGGRFIAKLVFTLERDNSITVQKYKPGPWEYAVKPGYEKAKIEGKSAPQDPQATA